MRSGGLFLVHPLGSSANTGWTDVKTKTKRISQRERDRRHRQREEDAQRRFDDNPNRILTFREWCALNGFAVRTGRRVISGEYGPPPVITRLSPRRIGISLANNARWQQTRERV
jgi:hypothetical protein